MFGRTNDNDITNAALNEGQRRIEAAMRSIAPRAGAGVDPIAAAYAAGRHAAARETRVWRLVAAVALVVGISGWFIDRGHDRTPGGLSSRVAVVTMADGDGVASQATSPPPSMQSVLMLRQVIREHGIDGLPASNAPTARPVRSDEIF